MYGQKINLIATKRYHQWYQLF